MHMLEQTLSEIQPQDQAWREQARAHLGRLTMPYWALGRLLDLAVDLAGITRGLHPEISRKAVVVMAADHGVAAEGVSAFPQEVTVQMVRNFLAGGAGINALARQAGAGVVVVNMGVAGDLGDIAESARYMNRPVAPGSANMARQAAMTRAQARQSIETGIAIARELGAHTDVFATGEMGIANTTPASAITAVMTGSTVAAVTGRGTGIDDAAHSLKIRVIEQALALHGPQAGDPAGVLAAVGGFEIGALAGLILGAAAQHKPVVIDGFISTAAALLAQALCPAAADYMIAAHCSVEPGHQAALAHLGKTPLLDLGLRLGEGTGAALVMNLLEAAVRVMTEVATFAEAAVSEA